jgi:Domain of unknown function (DUF4349)
MSQRDVLAELRAARVEAPPELRARVRLIAGGAETPRRPRVTWRRALVVALPVAAALTAGVLVGTRPAHERTAQPPVYGPVTIQDKAAASAAPRVQRGLAVPSPKGRVQRVEETLSLRLATADDVSDGVKRALRITSSLGGYPASVHASTQGAHANASLVLKIPRSHVQEAVSQLSELGTIVSEHVQVQDLQTGLNAADRTIARLQRQLKTLRAQEPLPTAQIAQLEQRIAALQRAQAATRRSAHYATISLALATPPVAVPQTSGHGPLHGVGVALRWLGIGAVYALAVGGPIVLLGLLCWLAVRFLRRRREDALLSRS